MSRHHTLRAVLSAGLAVLVLTLSGCAGSQSASGSPAPGEASSAPAGAPAYAHYVALGDSYSAAPLVPVTDVANGCFRSSANYPALVAEKLGSDLDDRTCAGASTASYSTSQFPDVPPQRTALAPDTDLVTIGLGGNDARVFGTLIDRCPTVRTRDPQGSPCRDEMNAGGRDTLLTQLRQTQKRLTTMTEEVRRTSPDAKVLLVGYPQILVPGRTCPQVPLATGDYAYVTQVTRALNAAVQGAAEATGSTYVDVWAASKGHDTCSADPWVNGAFTDQKRALRFHPFAEEQEAVAGLVISALGD